MESGGKPNIWGNFLLHTQDIVVYTTHAIPSGIAMRAIGGLETVGLAWRPSGRITGRFSVYVIIMPRKAIKLAFAGGW